MVHTLFKAMELDAKRTDPEEKVSIARYDYRTDSNGTTEEPDGHDGLDASNLPDYHDEEIKRICRKIDWKLPPVLALLYLLSFLDRSNIGNAKIAGMTKDLNMSGHDYNIALTAFFFPYAVFMIPSNMVLKRIRPSIWLAFLMVTWGTVMMCHGFVQTYHQLIAVRALLGFAECGFAPAAAFLLTCWYCRFELQTRVSLFFSAATLAGAFSGLLAYAIQNMDGVAGYEGWRWIFILEGLLTIGVGASVYWILPDSPRSCSFLTDREKDIVERRLAADAGTKDGRVETHDDFRWKNLWGTVFDWKVWCYSIIVCGQSISFYAFTFFCPTIVKSLGYKTWRAQLLTVPVYMTACFLTIVISLYADKKQSRWVYVLGPYGVASIGFLALLAIPHPQLPGLTYAFLYLIPAGLSCGLVAALAWVGNNLAPTWRRAIGMATVMTVANFGGSIGSNIYLEEQAPRYWLGFGFSLGVLLSAMGACLWLKYKLQKINRERDAMNPQDIKEQWSETQLMQMGDASPFYRYVT